MLHEIMGQLLENGASTLKMDSKELTLQVSFYLYLLVCLHISPINFISFQMPIVLQPGRDHFCALEKLKPSLRGNLSFYPLLGVVTCIKLDIQLMIIY